MDLKTENGNIVINNIIDFSVEETLECGQCFHFEKIGDMEYVVVAFNRLLHVKQESDKLIFFDKEMEEAEKVWIPYFDLERDYGEIKKSLLSSDEKLKEAVESTGGVRILNQEYHEMVISFIISQNKQIPHIKKIVFDLSQKYGSKIGSVNGKTYYSFPTIEQLKEISEEEFRELKTGFRAPYLSDAVKHLSTDMPKEIFCGMDYETAKSKLMEIKGVGEKVANCVLLFGLSFRNAFPVDVWIKRTVEEIYFNSTDTKKEKIMEFAKEKYGEYGGYAQQYLFYYGRNKKK